MLPVQCKMARVALGLGVRELADAAEVSPDTIARLERGEDLKISTLRSIQSALEAAGVLFVDENGEGPGVRLRKVKTSAPEPKGPATDAIAAMDQAIQAHKATAKRGK